jgi:hypothetical protein
MKSHVNGVSGTIEFDETNWREVLSEQYETLYDNWGIPGENMGKMNQMKRIAQIMVTLALEHGVDILDMTECLYFERNNIISRRVLEGGSLRNVPEIDFVTAEWKILELYAVLITPVALRQARNTESDVAVEATHSAVRDVLSPAPTTAVAGQPDTQKYLY